MQVAVAPGGARTYRVELDGEAPRPAGRNRRDRAGQGPDPGIAGPGGWLVVIAKGTEHRGQRLVRHLDETAPPVLVGDRYPVCLRPARELCPSCHRTSLPPALTRF